VSSEHTSATEVEHTGEEARAALSRLREEVGRSVVGQDGTVTGLVIALLCRGHVLLEGVPGVAKTLLVRSLSGALSLDFKRVQFTPDLMPGDLTGSLIYDTRTAEFEFREGPVFTNLLLADEVNRTPPKTQAALLEAMEERQVSVEVRHVGCRSLLSSPRRRTPSSTKAPTRCPRPSWTGSC
jgi:MoxR-like ATPase